MTHKWVITCGKRCPGHWVQMMLFVMKEEDHMAQADEDDEESWRVPGALWGLPRSWVSREVWNTLAKRFAHVLAASRQNKHISPFLWSLWQNDKLRTKIVLTHFTNTLPFCSFCATPSVCMSDLCHIVLLQLFLSCRLFFSVPGFAQNGGCSTSPPPLYMHNFFSVLL